jgi:hypothetical protein
LIAGSTTSTFSDPVPVGAASAPPSSAGGVGAVPPPPLLLLLLQPTSTTYATNAPAPSLLIMGGAYTNDVALRRIHDGARPVC